MRAPVGKSVKNFCEPLTYLLNETSSRLSRSAEIERMRLEQRLAVAEAAKAEPETESKENEEENEAKEVGPESQKSAKTPVGPARN